MASAQQSDEEIASIVVNGSKQKSKPGWQSGPTTARTVMGIVLGLASIIGFISIAWFVFDDLKNLIEKDLTTMPVQHFAVYVGGHACITVALAWVLYQLLKISERLLMPAYYIDQVIARNPDFLRHLLGVEEPTANLKHLNRVVEVAKEMRAVWSGRGDPPAQT